MSNTEQMLAQHPYIGLIASVIGFLIPFITAILPVFQFALVLASLVIAGLTIEAKWKERKIKSHERKRK